jgi:sulfite exporter TauE/SafE
MIDALISLFLTGILFGSGPCLASCGPILLSYIAGTRKNILKGLLDYVLFFLGRLLVYFVISLLLFSLGRLVAEQLLGSLFKYVVVAGGIFVITMGAFLALGRRMELGFCRFLQSNILEKNRGVFILGLILGLLPCAPLLAIFSYTCLISKSWFDSLLYIGVFGIGTFISPLLLLVVFAGVIPRFIKGKNFGRMFDLACGLVIIFLGVKLIARSF